MDLNNLYESVGSSGCGYTSNYFTQRYTDTVANKGVSDAYFLGYVSPDLLPSTSFSTTVRMEDNSFILEPVSKNNALMGYSWTTGMQYAGSFQDNVGNNAYSTGLGNVRYWNNFYPEFGSFPNTLQLHFFGTVYSPSSALVGISPDLTFTANSYADMMRVVDGYLDITLNSNSKTFNFKISDIIDGHASVTSSDNFLGSFWLKSFSFSGDSRYNGSNSYNSYSNYGFNIKTYGSFEDDTAGSRYILGTTFGSQSYLAMYYPAASYNKFRLENSGRNGGIYNKVTFTELPTSVNPILYNDGVLVHYQGQYNIAFYTYITNPNSIKNVLGLCFRTNPGGVASYITNMSFATSVISGQFESTLKTGDINDSQFKAGLEPWQYVDMETYDPDTNPQGVAVNDFTDEDVPPYEPTPPPTPGGEGNNPDNPELTLTLNDDTPEDDIDDETYIVTPINFPISSFMTQYILDAQDVYDMGLTLWSGLGDPNSNMIDNIIRVYGSSGTFNIANIMDFFVSVKAFPFNLNDANYIQVAPAMTVGTGAVPILNKQVTVFTASTYTLDCGTVSTVQRGAYRLGSDYDFRNYVNTAISCFLPFCGTVELDPSDVFPYDLHCIYFIDMISGSCTACVYVLRDGTELLVGSKTGQIGKIVPISANNLMGVVGAALSDVTSIAQTIGQTILNAAEKKALGSSQMPVNEASKNSDYLKELASYKENQKRISDRYGSIKSAYNAAGSAAQGISNVMTRNGVSNPSLSPGTGLEALNICRRPYITIRKLKYSSPNNYAHTTGFKCTDGTERKTISSYKGYTVFQNVDLSGIVATQEELDEIKALLETGVYL